MGSLGFWSMLAILYQAILTVIVGWLTLNCRFAPDESELHEVTLLKLLYLYDPVACGRIHFYNLTSINHDRVYASVVWPVTNPVASSFRTKLQLLLSLHIIWAFFAIINVTQGQRSCSFYATLLPFTITGVTLLVVDVIDMILFLFDARYTYNEIAILKYIASKDDKNMRVMNNKAVNTGSRDVEDTSWIAVLLAYISIRGIVQWLINFWIIKDNYFEGLERYRRKQDHIPRLKQRTRSSILSFS